MLTPNKQKNLAQLPCTILKGVGERQAERLQRCGIYTIQDLLFHLPSRYQDRTRITPLNQLRPGDQVVIEAIIERTETTRGRRPSLLCRLTDGLNYLTLRFFYFTARQQQTLSKGVRLRCFGEVRGWAGEFEMIHPEYQFVQDNKIKPLENRLTAIYPTTEGLAQQSLRSLTDQALTLLENQHGLIEYLPDAILQDLQLPDLSSALQYVHRPPINAPVNQLLEGIHPAQQRLAFEELLAHHLSLQRLRQSLQANEAPVLKNTRILTDQLLAKIPFNLTNAQQRVCSEIQQDLAKNYPMLRLLQGDVGSGKTIVAALAALQAVENNFQVALMAPTELLAEQHLQNFQNWLTSFNINVVLLTGKNKNKARQELLDQIALGAVQIVIGTHALFQEDIQFAHLGLAIIDEQHRFGVHQRLALREKGQQNGRYPHLLIMTATPIPRTLAMIGYADLDNSVIDELPPGRTPVQTILISDKRREEVIERVASACHAGRQVYWVCSLIDESEALQCQAAETVAVRLIEKLPLLKIGLVHGRQTAQQKENTMAAFKAGEIDLLVATTVIEVGVDVPNASLMVIENAERLGLAQLHQLRGRVGRGQTASFCVLIYQQDRFSRLARQRLSVMRETTDGFAIARRDLELRGPGEVFGTRQAGIMQMRVADLLRDQKLLPKIQQTSEILLREHPEIIAPLIERWLGHTKRYAEV